MNEDAHHFGLHELALELNAGVGGDLLRVRLGTRCVPQGTQRPELNDPARDSMRIDGLEHSIYTRHVGKRRASDPPGDASDGVIIGCGAVLNGDGRPCRTA
jgi:hypothetical protein